MLRTCPPEGSFNLVSRNGISFPMTVPTFLTFLHLLQLPCSPLQVLYTFPIGCGLASARGPILRQCGPTPSSNRGSYSIIATCIRMTCQPRYEACRSSRSVSRSRCLTRFARYDVSDEGWSSHSPDPTSALRLCSCNGSNVCLLPHILCHQSFLVLTAFYLASMYLRAY